MMITTHCNDDDDDGDGDDVQACEELGCRIDYLATHDYGGNAKHVMNRLEMLYNR